MRFSGNPGSKVYAKYNSMNSGRNFALNNGGKTDAGLFPECDVISPFLASVRKSGRNL
jgi:hypothetical protein